MNREDIIRMAREAGIEVLTTNGMFYTSYWDGVCPDGFVAAMTLAYEAGRKDEREECAKVCDAKVDAEYATGKVDHNEMGWTQACAIAIRARGQL